MLYILMALLMVLLGYLVRYRRWVWLIAGYNTSSRRQKEKYDADALCRGVGNFLFVLGAALLVSALGEVLGVSWLVSLGWALFVIVTVIFLVYANTRERYKQRKARTGGKPEAPAFTGETGR